MSKNLVLGLVAVVVLIGGFSFYSMQSAKQEAAKMDKEKMVAEQKVLMEGKIAAAQNKDNLIKEGAMKAEGTKEDMMKDKKMSPTTTTKVTSAMMVKDKEVMQKPAGAMMAKVGSYETYSASKVALASSDHAVVLFFRASWCPTCKAVDGDIKAHLSAIPANLTILDVDYDNSTELKQKYGVTYQHTFVEVDAKGNLIKKWSGSETLAALVKEIK